MRLWFRQLWCVMIHAGHSYEHPGVKLQRDCFWCAKRNPRYPLWFA